MPNTLTRRQQDALIYLYAGGDETIECRRARWVVTRYPQKCLSVMHPGWQESTANMQMPAGSRMVRETAKVEGRFGSCYTCESCLAAASREL